MTIKIPISLGYFSLIDNKDHDRVSASKWYAKVDKRVDGSLRVYVRRKIIKPGCGWTTQYLHRFILDAPDGMQVDHINGNTLDNRRENLRVCTNAENIRNQQAQKGRSSKFKGVDWHKNSAKWRARIKINGSKKHLGSFTSEYDAAQAYNLAALEMFGDFAKINRMEDMA